MGNCKQSKKTFFFFIINMKCEKDTMFNLIMSLYNNNYYSYELFLKQQTSTYK